MRDQALYQLARSLAAELSAADFPHLWRVQKNRREWWETLTTCDAWITLRREQNRISIHADHPREMKHSGEYERITVAADRKPEAIARDIANRLIPNARAYFRQCHEATRKDKEERANHAAILHALEPFKRWKNTESDGRRTSFYANRAQLDIYATKVYSLKIDSPTMEEVTQILALLERTPKHHDYD